MILVLTFAALWRGVLDQQASSAQLTLARQVQVDALNLTVGMVNQETGVRGYSATAQQIFLQPYQDGQTMANQALQRLRNEALGGPYQVTVTSVASTAAAWTAWAQARNAGVTAAGEPVVDVTEDDEGKLLFDQFRTADDQLIQLATTRVQDALRTASATTAALQWTLVIGAIPVVLSLVALGVLMTVSTLRPLQQLALAADRLAMGKPADVPGTDRRNEVGVLARALARWQQSEAAKQDLALSIRELSTPALRLKPGLLLLPIIGAVDGERAQQLTEQLLQTVRRQRARLVVIDVTGVFSIDSAVAAHLIRAAEACRLLGARVILTGLSPESADALTRLGVSFATLLPGGDLEDGIEQAERILGADGDHHADAGLNGNGWSNGHVLPTSDAAVPLRPGR